MNEAGELLPDLAEDLQLVVPPEDWSMPWYGYLAGLLLLIAFLLPLYLAFRKKSAAKSTATDEPLPDPARIALERLARLRQDLSTLTTRQLSLEVSAILRDYAEGRFGIRAPFLTTTEFLSSAEKASSFPRDAAGTIRELLVVCDRIKFAGSTVDSATFGDFLDYLHQFISQTRSGELSESHHE